MTEPRIPPGTRADIGIINDLITRAIGLASGGAPPNVFTTLARHPAFRRWLRFAGALMPGGKLPRIDAELLILRVAHNCKSAYEWDQHVRLGRLAGLTDQQIEWIRSEDTATWSPRQALLLTACDELHADRQLSDATWAALQQHLDEHQLIEVPLLVGHYEMLAMTLNTLRVQSDAPSGEPSALLKALQRLTNH